MFVLLSILFRFLFITILSYILGRNVQIIFGEKRSYLATIFGVGLLILIFSATNYIPNVNWVTQFATVIVITIITIPLAISRNSYYVKEIKPSKETIILCILQFLFIVLVSIPFIAKNSEFVTGYLVNHDSTVHNVITQDLLNLVPEASTIVEDLNLSTYPKGFHYMHALFTYISASEPAQTFYFSLSFFYSLLVFPLYSITQYFNKNSRAVFIAVFFPLLVPFGIQTIISGFAAQIAVIAFLGASFVAVFQIYTQHTKLYNFISTGVFISVSLILYQYTILSILLPFVLLTLLLELIHTERRQLYPKTILLIKRSIALGLVAIIIQPFSVVESFRFLFEQTTSTSEGGLFNVMGNSIGYISVYNTIGFNWTHDYRVLTGNQILIVFSLITLILSICVVIYLILKERKTSLGRLLAALNLSFLPLIGLSRFYLTSPYFYTKSLQFYSVFFVFSVLLACVYLCYKNSKNKQLLGLTLLISYILVFIYCGIITLKNTSPVPTRIFEEVNSFIDGDNRTCLYLDDTDWGRYMLPNCDVEVVVRANQPLLPEQSSTLKNLNSYDPDNYIDIQLKFEYLILNNVPSSSRPLRNFQLVGETDSYSVFRRSGSSEYSKIPLEREQINEVLLPNTLTNVEIPSGVGKYYLDLISGSNYTIQAEKLINSEENLWNIWDANPNYLYTFGKNDSYNGIHIANLPKGKFQIRFYGIELDLCTIVDGKVMQVGNDNEINLTLQDGIFEIIPCLNESVDNVMYLDKMEIEFLAEKDTEVSVCSNNFCTTFTDLEDLDNTEFTGNGQIEIRNSSNFPIIVDGIQVPK